MKDLSILIPTYNHVCTSLVDSLCQQAATLGNRYEIVVADDGSSDSSTVTANRAISLLPRCRYIERGENTGRAAIRNFLASQATHDWLVFIDSDMVVADGDFLRRYAECPHDTVVDGGVTIGGDPAKLTHNLRYRYEKAAEPHHTTECRRRQPYHDFHTANFMVRRDLMLRYPFDLRFRHYGYEDVLFGKQMEQHGIPIYHIDNPLSFEHFETNAQFLSKTEEGLRTLYSFRNELSGYSRLLDTIAPHSTSPGPAHRILTRLLGAAFRAGGGMARRWLEQHPNLTLFNFYRLSYFCHLSQG